MMRVSVHVWKALFLKFKFDEHFNEYDHFELEWIFFPIWYCKNFQTDLQLRLKVIKRWKE